MTIYQKPVQEAELKAKAVAPRVTDEQVEAFICHEHYFTAADGVVGAADESQLTTFPNELNLLTFCVLTLANGFTVHGISACASPANFNKDIGQRIARQDAKNKIWGHLGFELRSKLAMIEAAIPPSYVEATTYVGTKVIHAYPMDRRGYTEFRGWQLPADENGSDEGFLIEYADGVGKPNVPGFAGYVSWSPKVVFETSYGKLAG